MRVVGLLGTRAIVQLGERRAARPAAACRKGSPTSRSFISARSDSRRGARGGRRFHTLTPVRVYLRVGVPLTELLQSTLHELQHVADAPFPALSPADRERRAEAFVVEAMSRWPARNPS